MSAGYIPLPLAAGSCRPKAHQAAPVQVMVKLASVAPKDHDTHIVEVGHHFCEGAGVGVAGVGVAGVGVAGVGAAGVGCLVHVPASQSSVFLEPVVTENMRHVLSSSRVSRPVSSISCSNAMQCSILAQVSQQSCQDFTVVRAISVPLHSCLGFLSQVAAKDSTVVANISCSLMS
jgi:hypothetical protein